MISITTSTVALAGAVSGALHAMELTRQERQQLIGRADRQYNRGNYDAAVEAAMQAVLPASAMAEEDGGVWEMDTLSIAAIYAACRYNSRMAALKLAEARPIIVPQYPEIFGEIKDLVNRLCQRKKSYEAYNLMKKLECCYKDREPDFARMMLILAKEFRGSENGEKKCLSYAKRAVLLAEKSTEQNEVLLEALYILEAGYWASEQHQERLDCLKRILVLEESRENRSEVALCKCLDRIANAYCQSGKKNTALLVRLGLQPVLERVYGRVHSETQINLLYIGQMYGEQGEYEKGEPYLRQAVAILEDPYFFAELEVAHGLEMLGDNQASRWNIPAAEALYTQAMGMYLERLREKPSCLGGLLEKLERLHRENRTVCDESTPNKEVHHE